MLFYLMDLELFESTPPPTLPQQDEYLILHDIYMKGDDVQKLSVIQALPQLLQYDSNATLTRIVPKIQQELPKSSCEFHIATSKIFRLLIENKLPLNLISAVILGIDAKDPMVVNAWIETLIAVIPIISLEDIKTSVLPAALSKAQASSPVFSRINSCRILGVTATHPKLNAVDVKATILPTVQSLCQDVVKDVRAVMCSQLHLIAKGLSEPVVQSGLLPNLVELATDDNMLVRGTAVTAAVSIIPFLTKESITETIIPLLKQLCQKTSDVSDTTYPIIAKEFGKLVVSLQNDLNINDSVWFLQCYRTLSTKGQMLNAANNTNANTIQTVACREQCALSLPKVTAFMMSKIPNQLELWHECFRKLANDPCYLVRKSTAGTVHEIAGLLGIQCKEIKEEIVRLLRDDAEEVLQMLVPHLGTTLELLCANDVLAREAATQATLEIARAILKCHVELAKGHNWRIKTILFQQLEHLPNCMPSDFIHQHFSSLMLNCILQSRPKPVRSQASRTLLIFLRYNLKEVQRKWIRENLINTLCCSKSCYTRQVFILLCQHAIELFSNSYFKKFFIEPLLALANDPISNIRYSVVNLLPSLAQMLITPDDKKIQTCIENIFSKLEKDEKDRDVKQIMVGKLNEIKKGFGNPKPEQVAADKKKLDEEFTISQGRSIVTNLPPRSMSDNLSSRRSTRSTSAPSKASRSSLSGSENATSDMSFLEQHFYIDAGITLPRENLGFKQDTVMKGTRTENFAIFDTVPSVSELSNGATTTISAEDLDFENMTETEMKKLQISTTNITDDVKVNLRKRSKKSKTSKLKCPSQRHSSVLPTQHETHLANDKKQLNRRSLTIGIGDFSKIPVCLINAKSSGNGTGQHEVSGLNKSTKTRPRSENLTRSRDYPEKITSVRHIPTRIEQNEPTCFRRPLNTKDQMGSDVSSFKNSIRKVVSGVSKENEATYFRAVTQRPKSAILMSSLDRLREVPGSIKREANENDLTCFKGMKMRPKSENLASSRPHLEIKVIDAAKSPIKEMINFDMPTKRSVNPNGAKVTSALPVLKRRTQSSDSNKRKL